MRIKSHYVFRDIEQSVQLPFIQERGGASANRKTRIRPARRKRRPLPGLAFQSIHIALMGIVTPVRQREQIAKSAARSAKRDMHVQKYVSVSSRSQSGPSGIGGSSSRYAVL